MTFERPKEVTARHLNGVAAIYARQSSKKQDEENRGSLEYQRGQARYARSWGFAEDKIKPYEDRGLSGSGVSHRPDFLAVIDGIKNNVITAVFASDQSRLARNAVEWFGFLNLCKNHDVVLALDGKIINLDDGGDGFSSRIMALVDEYDLEKRRGHVLRGIAGRLHDGKAVTCPPTGYVSLKDAEKGKWVMDPDPAVQSAIAETFRIFLEARSCARAVRRMLQAGIQVPARKPGGDVYWVSPTIGAVRRILTNPAYCGDYAYRRRVGDRTRDKNRFGQYPARAVPRSEWHVLADHHAAYVSRDTWNEAQRILVLNAPSKTRRNLGPGSALLQGVLRCARHESRSMSVDYKEPLRDGRPGAHYYHCLGTYERGGAQCGAVPGRPLDVAIIREVFARLTRPSLETVRTEWDLLREDSDSGQRGRDRAVEQAQRQVQDLRARWLSIDHRLRDLAEDLEVRLNDAIGTLKQAQAAASAPAEEDFFTDDSFAELIAMCADLPALFHATTTTHRDRKEIVRTLVEKVEVTGRTAETISAVIYWADRSEPTPVDARLHRFVHRLIRELAAEGLGNSEIARRVNEMGFVTSRGKQWTRETVWVVRFGKGCYRRSA